MIRFYLESKTYRPPVYLGLIVMLAYSQLGLGHELELRQRIEDANEPGRYATRTTRENWNFSKTAIIVCDVWDSHHCLNAVRRVEEFAPRLNAVLADARKRGATIIHAPSDCMAAYETHRSRRRSTELPQARKIPLEIENWCSLIPAESQNIWPIDQSDGGEDDDPVEHAAWVEKLKSQGRNPGTPWLKQTELLDIDQDKDFISDKGDEVWNILESKGIENVILTGVHTNMCVIGRPFGLRQLVRNGKNVVLMRDMTDSMYNPKRWPFVDHFTGTELIIAHIERHVCPTITSDQLLGGKPFQFKGDIRETSPAKNRSGFAKKYLAGEPLTKDDFTSKQFDKHWSLVTIPTSWEKLGTDLRNFSGFGWFRCTIRVPQNWAKSKLHLVVDQPDSITVWVNGIEIERDELGFDISKNNGKRTAGPLNANEANLIVLRVDAKLAKDGVSSAPKINSKIGCLPLAGSWQFRVGKADSDFSNIPLPAKFGTSADIVHVADELLW